MEFEFSDEQLSIRDGVLKTIEQFDDAYWLAIDAEARFPDEFCKALAEAGWLGIVVPEKYGGAGLGFVEGALMMQAIAETGACLSGCSAVHVNIFGPEAVILHGTEEQRERWVNRLITLKDRACFGVTEPNAGVDTTRAQCRAEWNGKHYVVSGQKIWTTTAQEANKIVLLARTTPIDQCKRPADGLSLFYTDFDRRYVEPRVIPKMGREAVDTNQVFFDGLPVPKADLIGEEGKGLRYIFDSINPERIIVGAETVGIGRAALRKAAAYAKERIVFDRPIGKNQAIQHPLAESWCELEAANLLTFKAASLFDKGRPCGAEANAAKFLGAEAGLRACKRAIFSMGGMGYAKEFHVERYYREIWIQRIGPVTPPLLLSYIAERILGLPKSY
jgi:acyl-CoA dehydrogenase